jgi:hypothetical protein
VRAYAPGMVVAVVTAAVLFVVGVVLALRRPPHEGPLLEGNDPARTGAPTAADARGAVNRSSWMLGGGGGGGGG